MLTLIDFYADWCGPCQAIKPVVHKVVEELKDKVTLEAVNVDVDGAKASVFGVMSIPTLVLVKDGKEVDRKIGFIDESTLKNWLLANS